MLSEDNFDESRLIEERHLVETEIIHELAESSFRAEALLLTNYVENLLNDCIVYLMRASKARSIPRNVILEILVERGVIDKQLSQDIDRVFKIRDQFGHTMRLSLVEARVEPIIESMNVIPILRQRNALWDTLPVADKLQLVATAIIFSLNTEFSTLVVVKTEERQNAHKL